jgi:23S rRNA pseudouridine955/2504/2580 synthase
LKSDIPTKRQGAYLLGVEEDSAGQRLDNFLMKTLKGVPKSKIYKIIRKGEVRINGKRAKPLARLTVGDQVRIPPISRQSERTEAVGSFRDLDSLIVYEDDNLLILNKPAGMAVHGGSGVSAAVIESLRAARPEGRRLELVHRLDRGTSGCLMVAKRRSALKVLQDALRQTGRIRKHYLAVVHGNWPERLKTIGEPLLTVSREGQERFTRVSPDGKPAVTRIRCLAATANLTLLQLSPETGRTHQLRVHTRWARHPILGDDRYGDSQLDADVARPRRMMLHAAALEIPALEGMQALRVQAPMDGDMLALVERAFDISQEDVYKTIK